MTWNKCNRGSKREPIVIRTGYLLCLTHSGKHSGHSTCPPSCHKILSSCTEYNAGQMSSSIITAGTVEPYLPQC